MKIQYCNSQKKAERALRPLFSKYALGKPFWLATDIETFDIHGKNATDVHTSKIRTVQLNWGGDLIVLDFLYLNPNRFSKLKEILQDDKVLKIIHNGKFEWKFFFKDWKIRLQNIWDTMLGKQVKCNGEKEWGFGYKDLVMDEFGVEIEKETRQSDWSVPELTKKQIKYAARDVKYLPGLYQIQSKYDDRTFNIIELENKAIPVFAEMEINGIKIDETKVEDAKGKYEKEIEKILLKLQKKLPWVDIPKSDRSKRNLEIFPDGVKPVGAGVKWKRDKASGKMVKERYTKNAINDFKAALEILKIELPKKYDKNEKKYKPTLSVDVIDMLEWKHKKLLKEYFEKVTIYNKYLSKMEQWVHPVTGRVHYDVRQILVTGRCAKSNPPLQQMPTEQWFREIFIAKKGYVFVKIDYSQLELRLTAEISRDPILISEYRKGLKADLHTRTAISIYASGDEKKWFKFTEEERKKYRYRSKAANFGLIYGQQAQGFKEKLFADGLDLSLKEVKALRDAWFRVYKGVEKYHQDIREKVLKNFYIEKKDGQVKIKPLKVQDKFIMWTLGGRHRIWEGETKIKMGRVGVGISRWNRHPYKWVNCNEEYNHPIQGTAADGMKMAMVRVNNYLVKNNIDAKIVLQVHDELVLEVRKAISKRVANKVALMMEQEMQKLVTQVPIYCDVKIGKSWGSGIEYEVKRAA